jgi:hypothetical protein
MMPDLPANGVVNVTPAPVHTNLISDDETTTRVHGSSGVPGP